MDGSNAAFLLDDALFSPGPRAPANGILYIEDFDAGPAGQLSGDSLPARQARAEEQFTRADLDEARAAGREEGVQAALGDANLLQMQLQSAALQSVADGLSAARASLAGIAELHADELSRTVLSVLQAAMPAVMRTHAAAELRAVIGALAPGLTCSPELRVRAHPSMTDMVREALTGQLADEGCVLSVCADQELQDGDIRIAWQDGHARRDTTAIWAGIVAALAPLNLPSIEDICRGQ